MTKRAERPRDPMALAKLIGDIATGQTEDKPPEDGKNANAASLWRLGGAARARALSLDKQAPATRGPYKKKVAA